METLDGPIHLHEIRTRDGDWACIDTVWVNGQVFMLGWYTVKSRQSELVYLSLRVARP